MSDTNPERRFTEADVEAMANSIVDRLISELSDKRTVERITDAWSGVLDRAIGRGLRRIAGAVVLAVVMLAAVKLEVVGKFFR